MQGQAVVVVIECQGRILLLLRAGDSPKPWTFCFPGGHAEPGEVPKRNAVRETQEETAIFLHDWNRLEEVGSHDLDDAFITVFKYVLEAPVPGVVLSREHDGYLWVDPKEDWVHQLPFAGRVTRDVLATLR